MPTGITAAVQDGKVTALSDFALTCARQFGALMHLREEPMDAQVPDHVPALDSGYVRRIAEARARLDRLDRMSPYEAQVACQAANRAAERYWYERCDRRATYRVRYLAMLAKVQAWAAPTDEHVHLRDFMVKQLMESLDWDCSADHDEGFPARMRWPEWVARERREATSDLNWSQQKLIEARERATSATWWLRMLRLSLPLHEAAAAS